MAPTGSPPFERAAGVLSGAGIPILLPRLETAVRHRMIESMFVLAVLVAASVACAPGPVPEPAPTPTWHDLSETVTQVVWNEGQVDRLGEFYAEQVVRHVSELPDPIVGLEANQAYIRGLLDAFPDGRVELARIVTEGDWVAVHWIWTGTHTGDLPGLPATGSTLRLEGMSFVQIDDGKAVEIWDISDQLSMLRQLGVAPAAD
jgi:steroid delta-isomerase-like uncharacterized protein